MDFGMPFLIETCSQKECISLCSRFLSAVFTGYPFEEAGYPLSPLDCLSISSTTIS